MNQSPLFRKQTLGLLLISLLMSCAKGNFIDTLQGKWQVTEINYISSNDTTTNFPAAVFFEFEGTYYSTSINGTTGEFGHYEVNPKVTQIKFNSNVGLSTFLILEKTDLSLHWRSKNKIIDFYIDFKLEKVE